MSDNRIYDASSSANVRRYLRISVLKHNSNYKMGAHGISSKNKNYEGKDLQNREIKNSIVFLGIKFL